MHLKKRKLLIAAMFIIMLFPIIACNKNKSGFINSESSISEDYNDVADEHDSGTAASDITETDGISPTDNSPSDDIDNANSNLNNNADETNEQAINSPSIAEETDDTSKASTKESSISEISDSGKTSTDLKSIVDANEAAAKKTSEDGKSDAGEKSFTYGKSDAGLQTPADDKSVADSKTSTGESAAAFKSSEKNLASSNTEKSAVTDINSVSGKTKKAKTSNSDSSKKSDSGDSDNSQADKDLQGSKTGEKADTGKAVSDLDTGEANGDEKSNETSVKRIVAIDAGHQRKGNYDKEPIGPGATTSKTKVSSGTQGRFTGVPEYELNLVIAKKVKDELINRGYQVVMIRETHDVDLSNKERADIANESGADIFIRIHANGSTNPKVNGASTLYPSKKNPYVADLSEASYKLSKAIVDAMCESTGAANKGAVARDDMSGINWSQIPVTIIEMGYMTNEKEDKLMQTEEYQSKIVKGICDGIDNYFSK